MEVPEGRELPGFLRNLKDRFAPVTEEDYVDETESLLDAKEMLGDTRARMKRHSVNCGSVLKSWRISLIQP